LAAKATVGLIGFGAAGKLLRSSLRVFEGEKATTQRQQADAYDAQRQQISLELIQSNADKYGNELRAQLRLPSRLRAPENVATAAPVAVAQPAPAPVVVAPPAPVVAAAQTAPAPVAAPPAPVATAAPAREPVAVEQPAPVVVEQSAPVVVEQSAPEPAVATAPAPVAAPAPVMIKPIWGDSASYELYGIDTKSNLNFSQNISENSSFNGLSNENIKLSLNYEFSLDTAALQRLGLTQFQRTN
jgi:hypothetical protein